MDYLQIRQSPKLSGEVAISGAKNAALPLLALSLLSDKPVKISKLPNVADVKTFTKLLEHLGANVAMRDPHNIEVTCEQIIHTRAIYDIVRKMRASILVLGPLLTRFRTCEVSLPGGCAIGARPVDLHLKALEKMGAQIHIQGGYIIANAPNGLKGADILFDKISVTGSENIIMAAALAQGKTRIINAAKEPEVVQLCEVLRKSGIEIEGIGSNELLIHGSDGVLPTFKPFSVIPDRIEAGTYLCAGAITNSEITLKGVLCAHLKAILDKLEEIGFSFEVDESKKQESEKQNGVQDVQNLRILSAKKFNPFELVTTEYPGFPTDMQAQFMALATQCEGVSVIEERLFENRFMHVSELQRLGADIKLTNNIAKISGRRELFGASVMATDLRASSALVLAGLVAQGETQVHRIYHLDRGYEALEQKFLGFGADIARLKE